MAPEQRARLTAKALEAWRIGDWHGLNRELGLNVHETSPFDARAPTPPEWAGASYRWAFELRQALIEQGGPPGRVGRHGDPLGPARPRKRQVHADQAP
jgi:hypothetical protein